jgi:hypothetical protein
MVGHGKTNPSHLILGPLKWMTMPSYTTCHISDCLTRHILWIKGGGFQNTPVQPRGYNILIQQNPLQSLEKRTCKNLEKRTETIVNNYLSSQKQGTSLFLMDRETDLLNATSVLFINREKCLGSMWLSFPRWKADPEHQTEPWHCLTTAITGQFPANVFTWSSRVGAKPCFDHRVPRQDVF